MFPGQLNSASYTAYRWVQPFLHSSRQTVPILYNVCYNAINVQFKKLVGMINSIKKINHFTALIFLCEAGLVSYPPDLDSHQTNLF